MTGTDWTNVLADRRADRYAMPAGTPATFVEGDTGIVVSATAGETPDTYPGELQFDLQAIFLNIADGLGWIYAEDPTALGTYRWFELPALSGAQHPFIRGLLTNTPLGPWDQTYVGVTTVALEPGQGYIVREIPPGGVVPANLVGAAGQTVRVGDMLLFDGANWAAVPMLPPGGNPDDVLTIVDPATTEADWRPPGSIKMFDPATDYSTGALVLTPGDPMKFWRATTDIAASATTPENSTDWAQIGSDAAGIRMWDASYEWREGELAAMEELGNTVRLWRAKLPIPAGLKPPSDPFTTFRWVEVRNHPTVVSTLNAADPLPRRTNASQVMFDVNQPRNGQNGDIWIEPKIFGPLNSKEWAADVHFYTAGMLRPLGTIGPAKESDVSATANPAALVQSGTVGYLPYPLKAPETPPPGYVAVQFDVATDRFTVWLGSQQIGNGWAPTTTDRPIPDFGRDPMEGDVFLRIPSHEAYIWGRRGTSFDWLPLQEPPPRPTRLFDETVDYLTGDLVLVPGETATDPYSLHRAEADTAASDQWPGAGHDISVDFTNDVGTDPATIHNDNDLRNSITLADLTAAGTRWSDPWTPTAYIELQHGDRYRWDGTDWQEVKFAPQGTWREVSQTTLPGAKVWSPTEIYQPGDLVLVPSPDGNGYTMFRSDTAVLASVHAPGTPMAPAGWRPISDSTTATITLDSVLPMAPPDAQLGKVGDLYVHDRLGYAAVIVDDPAGGGRLIWTPLSTMLHGTSTTPGAGPETFSDPPLVGATFTNLADGQTWIGQYDPGVSDVLPKWEPVNEFNSRIYYGLDAPHHRRSATVPPRAGDQWVVMPLVSVTTGAPGVFAPIGDLPNDIDELKALGQIGQTSPWPAGDYLTLGDGSDTYWDGDEWKPGRSPDPIVGATPGKPGIFLTVSGRQIGVGDPDLPADLAAVRALGDLGQASPWFGQTYVPTKDTVQAYWDGADWWGGGAFDLADEVTPGQPGSWIRTATQRIPQNRAELHLVTPLDPTPWANPGDYIEINGVDYYWDGTWHAGRVGDPLAEDAQAGKPGEFLPAGSRAPKNRFELDTITPTGDWRVPGDFVMVGTDEYHWDGLLWVVGRQPNTFEQSDRTVRALPYNVDKLPAASTDILPHELMWYPARTAISMVWSQVAHPDLVRHIEFSIVDGATDVKRFTRQLEGRVNSLTVSASVAEIARPGDHVLLEYEFRDTTTATFRANLY